MHKGDTLVRLKDQDLDERTLKKLFLNLKFVEDVSQKTRSVDGRRRSFVSVTDKSKN